MQAKADENLTNRNLLSSSCDRSYLVAISSSSVGAGLGSCISSIVVPSGRLRSAGRDTPATRSYVRRLEHGDGNVSTIAGNRGQYYEMGDPQLDQVRTRWRDRDITTWCRSTA